MCIQAQGNMNGIFPEDPGQVRTYFCSFLVLYTLLFIGSIKPKS